MPYLAHLVIILQRGVGVDGRNGRNRDIVLLFSHRIVIGCRCSIAIESKCKSSLKISTNSYIFHSIFLHLKLVEVLLPRVFALFLTNEKS